MISEMTIAATMVYAFRYLRNAPVRKLSKKFDNIIYEANLSNKTGDSYKLKNIEKKEYGYSALVNIPSGMDIRKLESIKKTIETNLKCLVEIEQDKFQDSAYIKIITNPLNNLTYEVVPTKPYEMFLGYKYDRKIVKISMIDDPHLLIGGVRGSGKSRV